MVDAGFVTELPSGVMTTISADVPARPGGMFTRNWVGRSTVEVWITSLTVTVVSPATKFVPLTKAVVAPMGRYRCGLTAVTVGRNGVAVPAVSSAPARC